MREPTDTQARGGKVAEPTEATTSRWGTTDRNVRDRQAPAGATPAAQPTGAQPATGITYRTPQPPAATETRPAGHARAEHDERPADYPEDRPQVIAGPKPRASFLATLGLILSVIAAMLVLSGPLLGYGIGVAVLALILSLSGIHATGRRHVAGKTDALIGMFVSLAAIVVGVLALTGSLNWLGTDMHPVQSVRDWLDTNVTSHFNR